MIKITCDCKHTRKITELEPFQDGIKSMSKEEREKLISLIETYGLRFPFYVWGNKILDGHQKHDVLINDFKYDGVVPVVEIEAENEKEARELVLVSASQSGRFNAEELQEFTVNMVDLEKFSLIDGPIVNLDFKVDLTPKTKKAKEDKVKVADSDEYETAAIEDIKTKIDDVIEFPDGSVLTVGTDILFAEEMVRHWNSRNKTRKIKL